MAALKTLVIAMGLAIVIGATVLVTLIWERGSRLARGERAAPAAETPPGSVPVHALHLPAGGRVLEAALGEGRILVRAATPGGGEMLWLFDSQSGRPVARYEIAPDAGP